ncbi:MAG: 50S ribosomal protein L23 [Deferribacterales bacterium]|nr:50S ribosomal protein L23 [Deferribacterales bacterium]
MITQYDVLQKPLLTEKAMVQKESLNAVVFKVHPDATKTQIKEAVEKFFNVKVAGVRTLNFHGKMKRFGRNFGRRQDWKKAVVTLKEGEKLEFV